MDWRHRAICRDEDPELFFPVGTTGPAMLQIAEAKTVCRRCPVVPECLTWALDSGQDHGVYGGMSDDERRALKRRNGEPLPRTARAAAVSIQAAQDRARADRGRALLAAGASINDVAQQLEVRPDTVRRWRARTA